MIEAPTDFITAAKANGVQPRIMRRWLHRPEAIAFLRRERARFRASICAANEAVLAEIRDKGENAMARVRAVQVLEGIEDSQVAKPSNAPAPGVTVRIVNVVQSPAQPPTIDITPTPPSREPLPAPAELDPEPIFTVDR